MLISTHSTTLTQLSFNNYYLGYPKFHSFFSVKLPNYPFLPYKERWVSLKNGFFHLGSLNFHMGHRKNGCYHLGNLNFHLGHRDNRGIFIVKSNVTLETSSSVDNNEDKMEDIEDLNEREKLRRLRISKANKGNTPWNKGRKHSPETLQRIRERTRLAMQNPKVKMKLANLGHAQSEETKEKIAAGVRLGWQRRREKLMLQETCLFEWQNLVAEASRRGFLGEEELQWDSYERLNEQLQQEWLNSIELRKSKPRPKSSKRAPKSLDQRRKIAQAIAAKWADPDYRTKVCSGLAKYYGTAEGGERKPRRKPSSEARAARAPRRNVSSDPERCAQNTAVVQQPKLKKRRVPKYKDPLASYKLEMIKSIRAHRMSSESKKIEALQRAKLLIAEAEKAAKALEVAAAKSPVAQASLIESRKLIAEAIQTIESIHINMDINARVDNVPPEQVTFVEKSEEASRQNGSQLHESGNGNENGMSGVASVESSQDLNQDFNLYKLTMLDRMDTNYQVPMLGGYDLPNLDIRSFMGKSDSSDMKLNGAIRLNGISSSKGDQSQTLKETHDGTKTVTKKWIRGRLVEVAEVEVNA